MYVGIVNEYINVQRVNIVWLLWFGLHQFQLFNMASGLFNVNQFFVVGWLDNAGSFDKLIPLLSPGLCFIITCLHYVLERSKVRKQETLKTLILR